MVHFFKKYVLLRGARLQWETSIFSNLLQHTTQDCTQVQSKADFTNCIWPRLHSKSQGKTITETISAMIPVNESIFISLTKRLILLEPQQINISFSVIMDVQFHCFFLGSLLLHKTTKVIILRSSWHL